MEDGLEGLPGLLITIAFVFIFAGIFVPRKSGDLFLIVFLAVEIGAAILHILVNRRNRKKSEWLSRELHKINEQPDH